MYQGYALMLAVRLSVCNYNAMAEAIPVITESVKRLEFSTLHLHDHLKIITGQDEESWQYYFRVNKVGRWPHGQITATTPGGQTTETYGFELHGCGIWTDRRQNPVQTQNYAFTPYYDGLIVGDFMFGKFDGATDRSRFDKPGQQISEIVHTPYRENALLQILGNAAAALSVKQIEGKLPLEDPTFKTKEVRETLKKLAAAELVSFIQKRTQLFELATP